MRSFFAVTIVMFLFSIAFSARDTTYGPTRTKDKDKSGSGSSWSSSSDDDESSSSCLLDFLDFSTTSDDYDDYDEPEETFRPEPVVQSTPPPPGDFDASRNVFPEAGFTAGYHLDGGISTGSEWGGMLGLFLRSAKALFIRPWGEFSAVNTEMHKDFEREVFVDDSLVGYQTDITGNYSLNKLTFCGDIGGALGDEFDPFCVWGTVGATYLVEDLSCDRSHTWNEETVDILVKKNRWRPAIGIGFAKYILGNARKYFVGGRVVNVITENTKTQSLPGDNTSSMLCLKLSGGVTF